MVSVELIYCLSDRTWDTVIIKGIIPQGFENDDPEKEIALAIFHEDIAPTLSDVVYVGVYSINHNDGDQT